MDALTPIDAAALDSAVAGQPFPVGNHWRATRGDAIVDVFGTFHVYDARMEDTAERMRGDETVERYLLYRVVVTDDSASAVVLPRPR